MPTKITVIGAGNMGGALLRGWARAARKDEAEISLTATARTSRRLDSLAAEFPEIATSLSNTEAVAEADVIVIAVKPWLVADVMAELHAALSSSPRRPLIISVAAGIMSTDLSKLLDLPCLCVYAMPNIAAEYGESMTFVEEVSEEPSALAASLFEHVGKVRVVPTRLMAPGTMMAGCGIAYVMRYVRAMMEGGVEMGFYPDDARAIALQTMQGAVSLLEATGLHPEVAIDRVTTPGGITIRGLNELDHEGFNSAVVRSLKAGL